MQESRFEAIQHDAGALLAQAPQQYAQAIRHWHNLANGYVIFVLLLPVLGFGISLGLLLTTSVLVFTSSLLIGLFAKFAWLAVKLVFTEHTPTSANVLTRDQAPALFDLVSRVCEKLHVDPPQRIATTDTAYLQLDVHRRWRVFGAESTTLNIGWQLLFCVSEKELEALVAIQMAERCNCAEPVNSIRTIERRLNDWHDFANHVSASNNPVSYLFRPFFTWWQPQLYARSIVGARQAQLDAVRTAAHVTCNTATARALLNVNIFGEHLDEEFYPKLFRSAASDRTPPHDLMEQLASQTDVIDARSRAALTAAELAVECPATSLHLSLSDRLDAIQADPADTAFFTTPAAWLTVFHGKDDVVLRSLVEKWRETQRDWWQLTHDQFQLEQNEMEMLETQRLNPGMPVEDRLRHAELVTRRDGSKAARPLYAEIYQQYPEHPIAAFNEGLHLLATDRESGVPLTRYAIDKSTDWDISWGGWSAIRQYADRARNAELLQKSGFELEKMRVLFEEYNRERRELSSSDIFGHHGLDDETLRVCSDWLSQCPDIAEVYLYQKKVLVRPEEALLIMVIRRHPGPAAQGGVRDQYCAHIERINNARLGFTIAVFDHASLGDIKPEQRLANPERCRIYFSSLMNRPARKAARLTLMEASFTTAFTGLGLGLILLVVLLVGDATASMPQSVADLLRDHPFAMAGIPLLSSAIGAITGYRKRHRELFAHREAANVLLS